MTTKTKTDTPTEPQAPVTPNSGTCSVDRDSLLQQLKAASLIAKASNTLPVLKCVLVDFAARKLRIHATDLDNLLTSEVEAETTDAAKLAVPATPLMQWLGLSTAPAIRLTVSGLTLQVSDGINTAVMDGISFDAWVPTPSANLKPLMEIGILELRRVLRETIRCASRDESRYFICSVALITNEGCAVATDGRRLVRIGYQSTLKPPIKPELILRKDTVALIQILPGGPASILCDAAKHWIQIQAENERCRFFLTSKFIDGRYPNYRNVIPSDKEIADRLTVSVNRSKLVCAARRVAVWGYTASNNYTAPLQLTVNPESIAIETSSPTGKSSEIVPIKSYHGDGPVKVAVNAQFLYDILDVWDEEMLLVTVKDDESPIVIHTPGKVAVIMPVKL